MALATIADYELITGIDVPSGAATTRVTALIALAASAVLAGAHGQQIESATVTAETIRPYEGIGYFKQRPVTAVATVAVVHPDGTTTAQTVNTDYRWTRGGNRRHAKLIRVVGGIDSMWGPEPLLVTYTAGWATVPAQITAAIVAMVNSTMVNGAGAPNTSASVGPFTRSQEPGEIQSPTMRLNGPTQSLLDDLCGVDGFSSVPVQVG